MRRRPIPRVVVVYEYGNWIARWKCHLQCRVKRIVKVATDICHRCFLTKLICVAAAANLNSIRPTRSSCAPRYARQKSTPIHNAVQRKCEAAIDLAVVYTLKQGAIEVRNRCPIRGVPSFEEADRLYANTGIVHIGKPQYRPTQTQEIQVLHLPFCFPICFCRPCTGKSTRLIPNGGASLGRGKWGNTN